MVISWQCYSISVTPLIASLYFPHVSRFGLLMTPLLEALCKVCVSGGLAFKILALLWTLSKYLKDLIDCQT